MPNFKLFAQDRNCGWRKFFGDEYYWLGHVLILDEIKE
jgi:hypothetical protein